MHSFKLQIIKSVTGLQESYENVKLCNRGTLCITGVKPRSALCYPLSTSVSGIMHYLRWCDHHPSIAQQSWLLFLNMYT